jgi:hypothetical protein
LTRCGRRHLTSTAYCAWRQTGRPASADAYEVRNVYQPQGGHSARDHGPPGAAFSGGRGDRIPMLFAAAHMAAIDVVDGARSQQRAALARISHTVRRIGACPAGFVFATDEYPRLGQHRIAISDRQLRQEWLDRTDLGPDSACRFRVALRESRPQPPLTATAQGQGTAPTEFGYVLGRNPMPSVFRDGLRKTYELCDEPLPPRLQALVHQLREVVQEERETKPRSSRRFDLGGRKVG